MALPFLDEYQSDHIKLKTFPIARDSLRAGATSYNMHSLLHYAP